MCPLAGQPYNYLGQMGNESWWKISNVHHIQQAHESLMNSGLSQSIPVCCQEHSDPPGTNPLTPPIPGRLVLFTLTGRYCLLLTSLMVPNQG